MLLNEIIHIEKTKIKLLQVGFAPFILDKSLLKVNLQIKDLLSKCF